MNKLKSCPFCGKEAYMRIKKDRILGNRYIPQCTDTSCPGRSYRCYHTEKAAENAWNRRADNSKQHDVDPYTLRAVFENYGTGEISAAKIKNVRVYVKRSDGFEYVGQFKRRGTHE